MEHNELPDFKVVAEALGAFALGAIALFGKRTLASYDRRIETAEQNDKEILELLKDLEIKLTHVETILEERTSREH